MTKELETIILLGSNSYIARNFTFYLRKKFADYCLIGYSKNKISSNFYLDEYHSLDLSILNNWDKIKISKSVKFIINFASISHVDYSFNNVNETLRNNLGIARGLKYLREQYLNKGIKFIHVSTDEIEVKNGPTSPYSWSKLAQEKIISSSDIKIVRLNNIYGVIENLTELYPTQPIIWNNLNKMKRGEIKYLSVVSNYGEITRNFMPIIVICKFLSDKLKNPNDLSDLTRIYKGYPRTIKQFIKDYMKKYSNYNYIFKIIQNRPKTDYNYPVIKSVSKAVYKDWL